MEKMKQNRIWLTIIVIGVIVIAILLAMLHQQKENSPAAQSSSYASSMKAASESTAVQDKDNEKAYAKEAANMKGHVLDMGVGHIFFTSWNKSDLSDWAQRYMSMPIAQRHQNGIEESFGTSYTIKNDKDTGDFPLDEIASQIKETGSLSNYYETVEAFNHQNPGVNPDDIKK